MAKTVLICGKLFDGAGDALREHVEILIEGDSIIGVSEAVGRPEDAQVIDLGRKKLWGDRRGVGIIVGGCN